MKITEIECHVIVVPDVNPDACGTPEDVVQLTGSADSDRPRSNAAGFSNAHATLQSSRKREF